MPAAGRQCVGGRKACRPRSTPTKAVGVTWLYGFQFEIKVIAKLPADR
ncbi:hypothetical protein predicted by Glimmer/Critica [Stenotrophomonas maltophilia RA8]|nr:hypothetical protein predicted by Glimmer/Critica [Stenotrophomonas maltophilia RA8]